MKKIALALLIAALPFAASAQDKKESAYDRVVRTGTIRCGFIPWPPGFGIDPNSGKVTGPGVPLFESIIGLAGWKTEFVETQLGNAPLDMENGKIDAMCGDGPWTITNVKLVDYTTPVAYTPVFLYVRDDEKRFSSYADVDAKGVSLVGIDGDISTDLAARRFPKATVRTLINLTDPAMMLREVADGKADAVILDPVTADGYLKNNPGQIKMFLPETPLAVYPIGLSVARGENRLQQTLDRATEMAMNIGLADDKLDGYDPARRTLYSPAKPYVKP